MAKLYNLAVMTVASTGTGPIALGAAATINGVLFLSFAAAGAVNGETIAYSIADIGASEEGTALYSSVGPTITRTPVTSTNGNAAINVTAAAIVRISPGVADLANLRENNVFSGTQNIFTGKVGVGKETNPQNALVVSNNTATGLPATGVVTVIAADGVGTQNAIYAYGNVNGSTMAMYSAGGTGAAPTNLLAGSNIGALTFRPYLAGAFTTGSSAGIFATYLDASPNLGTALAFNTTPLGGSARAEAFRAQHSGGLSIGAAAIAADPGIGSLNVSTAVAIGAPFVPDAYLTINGNTVAPVAPSSNGAHIVGADGASVFTTIDMYGSTGGFQTRRANGTSATKTAIANGDVLMNNSGQGWNGSAYRSAGNIRFLAGEAWTGTANGSYFSVQTVPLTTLTAAEAFRAQPSGGVSIGAAAIAADPGVGSLNMTGTLAVAASASLVGGTAPPAGGSGPAVVLLGPVANSLGNYYGSGAPSVAAGQGSIYLRTDGSGIANRLYVNTNGSTTWTNFASAA